MRFNLILLFIMFGSRLVFAQTISGTVKDEITSEPIPFAKIYFSTSKNILRSQVDGSFSFKLNYDIDTLFVEFLGYKTKKVVLYPEMVNSPLEIVLSESTKSLNTVLVEAGENPAFEILEGIKKNKKTNNPEKLDSYECKVYNKMQFDINNMSDKFQDRRMFKKFDFIMDYMDSTSSGENYLPVLLSESISDYYFKKNPVQRKEVIKGNRVTGIDNLQLGQYTGDLHQNVNIYDDYVELFNKEFMSPIADECKLFYKYYLQEEDTLNTVPCYHLKFTPRRKGGALFYGDIWVTQKDYAVKRIEAAIPDDVNLNYVSAFYVAQDYSKVDSLSYMVTSEKVIANLDVFNEAEKSPLMGVTIRKTTTRTDFVLNETRPFEFYITDVEIKDSAVVQDADFWIENRPEKLSIEEQGVIEMVDSLKENKTYKFYENLAYMSYTGFWRTGPIEIGNIYSIYNQNVVEGTRLMLSLRTSNKFSKKVEISGFTGYGTLDKQWKYGASVRYKVNNSPREMLRFGYRKRIDQLGLIASIGGVGNSFSTLLSAAPLDKLTMVDLASVGFEKDYRFDMRTFNTVEWKRYVPLGSSDYSRIDPETGDTNKITSLTSFQIRNQIMFTKEEKFLQGQFDRVSLGSKYPIISLTHTWGIDNFLQSESNFHRLDFIWTHRPRIGMAGRLNYTIQAGKIFGQVPYPFLQVHQGNETYYLQENNFNLMNYYEFISDQWIRILFEHRFQGFIMDRVPLVRKLKLRLVYSGKMVIGSYSDKHNKELLLPFYSKELSSPYYEAGVGLENILKFIRVDAVWRLSYRDNLDLRGNPVSNFGVKFMFTSDF